MSPEYGVSDVSLSTHLPPSTLFYKVPENQALINDKSTVVLMLNLLNEIVQAAIVAGWRWFAGCHASSIPHLRTARRAYHACTFFEQLRAGRCSFRSMARRPSLRISPCLAGAT
jgi:hypothetical protein